MSSIEEIAAVAWIMESFPHPWFVSGGWAIDLYIGEVTRHHEDREIGIFREDQQALRAHLSGRDLFKSVSGPDGGEWVAWEGEWLELPVFQLLARPSGLGPPRAESDRSPEEFEFFLNDAEGGLWRCRRNEVITRPVSEIFLRSPSGIPILAPEIQLLYKAKWHRPKDEHDFQHALAHLDSGQRAWLRHALLACYGPDPWIAALE
jgi:hypothetical protein